MKGETSDSGTLAERAVSEVRRRTRGSGTSFYYSFLLLPRAKREAIYSVYAFCRAVDDVVDEAPSPETAARQLLAWEEVVDACYGEGAGNPVGEALTKTVREFGIPKQHFLEVLSGVRMDLTCNRYPTFEDLLPYCERVAGAVGLICIRIFGLRGAAAEEYAHTLGIALQLINIARDVSGDARRGRIYLPLADLERFGVTEEEVLEERYSARFAALMAHHAERARSYLSRADASTVKEDRWLLFPAEAMKAIYRALLEAIEKADYDVFSRRISISPSRRLALALGAWLASIYYRAAGNRWRRSSPSD